MYIVWKILGTLGCYVDNERIPLKIIYLYFKIELWHLCKSLLPSTKGLSFTFMQESIVFLLIPTYSLVGKHRVMGKDLSIYGHSNIFDQELLLLTIIYMINKLGGKTLSPYLSLCLIDMLFVLKICFECQQSWKTIWQLSMWNLLNQSSYIDPSWK